ncbi:MAG: tetratricopeptide repeat protein [Prevotella sp.]|jgi:tetratricopeptide (TPR) repeat protein|nr:tetratricopeptide repeat protein [Prevotella sp.]
MKSAIIYIIISLFSFSTLHAQTLAEARELYTQGDFEKALPVFEKELAAKPNDVNLNHWYGVCLYETGGDRVKAEESLLIAAKKNVQDSFYYLGLIYTEEFRFTEAEENFNKYETLLTKKKPKKKDEIDKQEADLARLGSNRKTTSRLKRMVSNTEDIQIIDSVVVDKKNFLSAYKLSHSSGRLDYFNTVFTANKDIESVVYFNEKETKIYYGQPDKNNIFSLYSMEKLLNEFGNEKKLSSNNFGIGGNINYPYVMADGVTIYFAAKDPESIGGYDLFISRYNINNDTYLTPERLNMPFNSQYNDYMMVVDEEKGVGWFASDRFQPEGSVCIYTFIPNSVVKTVQSEDEKYLADRARISSIRSTWEKDKNYNDLIALARKAPKEEAKEVRDFTFVVNDKNVYYKLTDFKNTTARDTYYKVIQKNTEKRSLTEKLEGLRTTYSRSNDNIRRNMTTEMLGLERQIEELQKEIPSLEIQARNQEIQSLN